jgi:small subunit ribosomal protein S3Ae
MVEIMANQASTCDLKELVSKFIPEVIGKEIEKATSRSRSSRPPSSTLGN